MPYQPTNPGDKLSPRYIYDECNRIAAEFEGMRANAYSTNFRPGDGTATWTSGAGTPEGAVTAVVGSLYTRTDGGASTTLYVKESGTGNTGWVAK